MARNYETTLYNDYLKLQNKSKEIFEENKLLKYEKRLLQIQCENNKIKIKKAVEKSQKPLINENNKLKIELEKANKEIERLKGILNADGTNSGLPTSKTPISKKKVIPNNREKTDKIVGGQVGHKKHKLEKFTEEEINENEYYELDACPCCGGKIEEIGEITKDETEYLFLPIKRRHHYKKYKCSCCNKEVHSHIPNHLKEENQYGANIKSLALTLNNEGNMPFNKISKVIRGLSENEINMSEGFIAKLQKTASQKLETFISDVKKEILKQELIYWDDTVIDINSKRSCLRFYGNEKLAYYVAHEHKNEEGILEDGILNTLSDKTTVMHDHLKINYNKKFSFNNIECNIHLLRDLQKCSDNAHTEGCMKLAELIRKTIHDKKEIIKEEENVESFKEEYIKEFNEQFEEIMLNWIEENKNNNGHYKKDEMTLINRILEYKTNYFLWIHDFSLPSDDNLSERALRGVKTKQKVSGQFKNVTTASYYANIKTYIETCYRNNINPTRALNLLMTDNPLKLVDILNDTKKDELI